VSDTNDIVHQLRAWSYMICTIRGEVNPFSERQMARNAADEIERLRAEVAALKAQPDPLNDAVEEACGEMPEGWSVGITLERGAATVYVFDPEGESEMVHEDETKVADLVREAIRRAKEANP
jgi:hypothetical protein